jgi:hypothetical protein
VPDLPARSKTLSSTDGEILRIARRMRQLAGEIHDAWKRNDLALVKHASTLLAPTLAQWHAAPPTSNPVIRAESARLAREARALLDQSAAELSQYMGHINGELQRLHRARQTLARMRARGPAVVGRAVTGRRLDKRF